MRTDERLHLNEARARSPPIATTSLASPTRWATTTPRSSAASNAACAAAAGVAPAQRASRAWRWADALFDRNAGASRGRGCLRERQASGARRPGCRPGAGPQNGRTVCHAEQSPDRPDARLRRRRREPRPQRAVLTRSRHLRVSACECLTTFVSASATMKYALASISAGSRSAGDLDSTGRSSRATTASTPARRPPRVRTAGRIPWASSRSRGRPAPPARAPRDQRLRVLRLVPQRSLSELERHDRVHQPLLRAVVQVAHDAAASLVSCGEQARPRGVELVAAVGVRDGGVEQLRRTRPCAPRYRRASASPAQRRDHAPEPPVDDDRRSDVRADRAASSLSDGAPSASSGVPIRAGRPVRRTIAATLLPSLADREPGGTGSAPDPRSATTVMLPSGS